MSTKQFCDRCDKQLDINYIQLQCTIRTINSHKIEKYDLCPECYEELKKNIKLEEEKINEISSTTRFHKQWMPIMLACNPPISKYVCPYCNYQVNEPSDHCPKCGEEVFRDFMI